MDLLKEIKDGEIPEGTELREAARAVLFDENNKIPILFVSKKNYHKLPGGGIEKGEDKPTALKREVIEEVGSEIELEGTLGKIIEYRSKWNLYQKSYCYYGRIINKGKPSYTEKEISEGFELLWVTVEEAINLMQTDTTDDYDGSFIVQRDIEFVKKVFQMLNKH